MFTGLKEILVIVAVLLGVILLPRMLRSRSTPSAETNRAPDVNNSKTGVLRLALFISVLWVVSAFVLMNPLQENWRPFFVWGIFPVALGWGIRWVVIGFK